MVVTDGNDISTKSMFNPGERKYIVELCKNVKRNFGESGVEVKMLIWDKEFKAAEKFDYILIADCLYYVIYHDALIHTITELMHPKSTCIIIAPKRGVTMDQFMEKIALCKAFKCSVTEHITEEVDAQIAAMATNKLYRSIEHKPYMITLTLM